MGNRNFKSDYLSGASELSPFHRYPYGSSDYGQMIRDRAEKAIDRETLVAELLKQNEPFREAANSLDNIRLLADPNTFTVTTGHQLVMMGGPLYTLYKIASAIVLARRIQERNPGYNVVPVFWMASEDHDWEEINHFHPAFFETRTYGGSFSGPVGRHWLEPRIIDDLGEGEAEFTSLFSPNHRLSEAFRRLVLKLFGKYGLVVIDADSKGLKSVFKPWMEAELKGEGMGKHVIEASAALEAAGYKVQVHPREVNLFYMEQGGRELLFREEGMLKTKDGSRTWSEAEMLDLLADHPARFSPNVAMRPLYQEVILPNLAYIGGWAEMSYWHQFKWAFDALDVHFPLLLPRMSATLYKASDAAAMQELGLPIESLGLPLHQLFDAHTQLHKDDTELDKVMARITADFDELAEMVGAEEATMSRNVLSQQAKTKDYLAKLKKKLAKVYRNKHAEIYAALERVKGRVEPEGTRQERHLNFTAVSTGDAHELVELIMAECEPEKYEEKWIQLP